MRDILTVEEAKTKWCPLARAADSREADTRAAVNRFGNAADVDCMCLASACMAWRKADQIGITPEGKKVDRDMDGRVRWVDRGYCGAFGEPKP